MLFDSHCHPQFAAYDEDREEMIRRNIAEDVFMIAVGTSYETSKAAAELAKSYPGKIWATAGIHPHHAVQSPRDPQESKREIRDEKIENRIIELVKTPEVAAVGETGLDYHYIKPEDDAKNIKNAQRALFFDQIELAKEFKKPLVIHARDAYDEVYEILHEAKFPYGITMHFFQGNPHEAQKFLELGAYISFAGPITFTNQYDETIRAVPIERMLIETDAPYATPAPHRGQRNEPRFVRYVVQKIAKIKNESFERIAEITARNTKKLFYLSGA